MDTARRAFRQPVTELATTLSEDDPKALLRLEDVLQALGNVRCQELVAEAVAVQERGGMIRADGGRRTLGGIFFFLAKSAAEKASVPLQKRFSAREESTRGDAIPALLGHIATCANDAITLFPDNAVDVPPQARQKLSDLQSLMGTLREVLRKKKTVSASKGKITPPHGGIKQSGLQRESTKEGFLQACGPLSIGKSPRIVASPNSAPQKTDTRGSLPGQQKPKQLAISHSKSPVAGSGRRLAESPPRTVAQRSISLDPKKTGKDKFDVSHATENFNRVKTAGSGQTRRSGSRRENRGHN